MKELLTKQFWRDVKNTFDEARADTTKSEDSKAASPVEAAPEASPVVAAREAARSSE